MSQIFGAIIKLFFGALVHDISLSGVLLRSPSGYPRRIFAKLGMFVQDGAAHKSVWHCKGDAGTKPCMLCLNLYTEKSELVGDDEEHLLTCTLVHEAELHFASDADVRGSVHRLAARRLTDNAWTFELRQQAAGFRYEQHSMLLDQSLDELVHPVSQFVHDWMHAIMVHGVMNTTVYLFLEAFIADGTKDVHKMLHGYLALWSWPSRISGSMSLKDIVSPKRASSSRKAKLFKCTASDGLSLLPVIAHFAQAVLMPSGKCSMACRAVVALAEVVDLLQTVPLDIVKPEQLKVVIKLCLELCIAAGWRSSFHPKFHWMVHQHGCLPTCWVHERKHRMVKRYASDAYNTQIFEHSVIGEVVSHHVAQTCR